MTIPIRPIRAEEISTVSKHMADAFLQDAAYEHIIHCPRRRYRFLQKMMALRLRSTMGHRKVFVTEDGLGVVACRPSDEGLSVWEIITLGGLCAALSCNPMDILRLLHFMGFADRCEKRLVSQGPGWIIGPLAVSPAAQSRGYGSALLRYVLDHAIPAGTDALLETQSARNRNYYHKFGFFTAEETVIPGSGAPNITMRRAFA